MLFLGPGFHCNFNKSCDILLELIIKEQCAHTFHFLSLKCACVISVRVLGLS